MGIDSDSLYDTASSELRMLATAGFEEGIVEATGSSIVLAGQHRAGDMAAPRDLLLALAWSVSKDADALAVGAR